jgi:hypothetical protein
MSAHLKSSLLYEKNFRWRAGEITRLEGFSDAVFAFAVTLLVVSLEVPHTFAELTSVMKGFVAFGICFALLTMVWKEHTLYFRRYGLQTSFVVVMNCVLLFLVLFYVYPLKFLFSFLVSAFSGGRLATVHSAETALVQSQVPALMAMYGLGFAAVYLVFVALYVYALRKRNELELDEIETFKTRRSAIDHGMMMGIGLLSTVSALALPSNLSGLSGYIYFLIPVYYTFAGSIFGNRLRRIEATLAKRELVEAGVTQQ